MIEFSKVAKRYANGYEALKDVSLTVREREFVLITGHSGAGKSTLLKLACGIERATAGSVSVSGQRLDRMPDVALTVLRSRIGLVFQDHKLLFDRNVFANISLPLEIAGAKREDIAPRVRAALDKVGLLGREHSNPISLSGGEQQRLCIARAIVNRPAIIIADEPTGNLDLGYARQIISLLQSFHEIGVTVLVSTHDESSVAHVTGARRIAVDKGEIIFDSAAVIGAGVEA
jgi:cell division transport system ATP-binding protein